MALGASSIGTEVQALTGRTGDTVLVTAARVNRWLNEAQVKIAEEIPGLIDLEFDCTSWTCSTSSDMTDYGLVDLTVGDDTAATYVCHLHDIFYVDGAESYKLDFQPQDEFDSILIDPTHLDFSPTRPTRWTRQGAFAKLAPLTGTDYSGKVLRVHGTKYAADITGVGTSNINHADNGLIYYCVAQAWGAIGNERKHAIWRLKFQDWLSNFKAKNDRMGEWDGETAFDYGEDF